jgi:hypothetical protein
MSLAGLAVWLHANGDQDAYRAALGFVSDTDNASDEDFATFIAQEPAPTGDHRVDALLAAMAEHLASQRGIAVPYWCEGTSRFLSTAWFPVDLASIRVRALVSAPASFWRRLIFIDRSDLHRV